MKEKPNLDVLRAIAIILVVFDHTTMSQNLITVGSWRLAWMGVFGVYLFFVHTCLVLMWSLDRKPHTLDFYIRRVFRIYPLAVVLILCVLLFHLPFSSDDQHLFTYYPIRKIGVIANLFLMQNIAGRGGYVLGVLWSLPLEIDMYVLLPVLYFFVRKNFSLWPLLLLWGLACGLVLNTGNVNIFATVIPCFLPGVMAYVLYAKVTPRLPAWTFPLFLAILLVCFMPFSSVRASWLICLALGLGLPFFRQIRSIPLKRIAHELAKYSYSIYLGHMFALGIALRLLPRHGVPLMLMIEFALIALFAVLGYHLIERPMIIFGAKLAAKAELRYEQHQR